MEDRAQVAWWARVLSGCVVGVIASVLATALVFACAGVAGLFLGGFPWSVAWSLSALTWVVCVATGVARSVWRGCENTPRA